MRAYVLLNILNELRKSEKMQDWLSNLSLFCNKFKKINNTGARMSDSIYYMALK